MNRVSQEQWTRLWPAVCGKAAPDVSFAEISGLYSEPHRHYHNLHHIADCLSEFDRVRHLAGSPLAVELALWFHDAVYNPKAGDNEERSAELARAWLARGGAEAALIDAVAGLVMATKAHDASGHPDAPLMVDVDLSILGQPAERFWEYERQIRQEYEWVSAEVFAVKRAEVLEGFLRRKQIYLTADFRAKFESTARANLQASIQRLRSGIVRH